MSNQSAPHQRLTVAQAADQLGISEDAVRSRLKRGTLQSVRESGAVYVLLAADQSPTDRRDQLIEELRDRVRSLEEANRENRRIIAGLVQRVPELEASESSGPGEHHAAEPHEASEDSPRGAAAPDPAPEPRRTLGERLRAIWRGPR